jgi:hypothetical protein
LWRWLSSLQTLELHDISLSPSRPHLSCYGSLTRLVLDRFQPNIFPTLESLSCWRIEYNVMTVFVWSSSSAVQRISSIFLPIPLECLREQVEDGPSEFYSYIYDPCIVMPQLHTIAYYMSDCMEDDMFLNNELSLPTDFHLSSIWPILTRFFIEVSVDELSSSSLLQSSLYCHITTITIITYIDY